MDLVERLGLKRFKSASLDLYLLFGLYLKLQEDLGCYSSWIGNWTFVPFQQYMAGSLINPDKR
jgi:hypothetical protein